MRENRAWSFAIGALICCTACVYYDIEPSGRACGQGHPCPEGYICVSGTCTRHAGDGGMFDGGASCREGETRCEPQDLSAVRVCEGGAWVEADCGEGRYCLLAENDCVDECLASRDCPEGTYCDPDDHRCEARGDCRPAGMTKCRDMALDAVLLCAGESGFWEVIELCDAESGELCDPFDPMCKGPCASDADCAGYPATPTCDLAEHRCSSMFLCAEGDCAAGARCVHLEGAGGACVADATEQALVPGDLPADLSCFAMQASVPPASPETCEITGRAIDFHSTTDSPDPDKEGVRVELFPIDAVLSGSPGRPTHSATVDETGHYSIPGVATNTEYAIKTSGSESDAELADLYTFGVFVRSDACVGDQMTVDAYTISNSAYQGYTEPLSDVVEDPNKGVVLGRISECGTLDPDPARVANGTASLSMPHDRFYYMNGTIPDFELAGTGSRGLFAAANVTPIQGVVAAMARDETGPVSLGAYRIRVLPGAASLVLFRRPLEPE
ncbi:MAG: hypothetical protein JXR96_06535 [Deltaproteobacteria bacterium]|nr:hypothetical protein [Deltaproteobacteria bacterium]